MGNSLGKMPHENRSSFSFSYFYRCFDSSADFCWWPQPWPTNSNTNSTNRLKLWIQWWPVKDWGKFTIKKCTYSLQKGSYSFQVWKEILPHLVLLLHVLIKMDTRAGNIKNRSISLAPVLRQFVTPFRQFRVIQAILSKERKTVQLAFGC